MSIDVRHESLEKFRAERDKTAEVIQVPDPVADAYDGTSSDENAAAGLPIRPLPFPPFLVRRSGIYRLDRPIVLPPIPGAFPDSAHPDPNDPSARPTATPDRPRPDPRGVRERCRGAGRRRSERRRVPVGPVPAVPTATRYRGIAGGRRRGHADDDRQRDRHPDVRWPAHLDRPGHEGPGDRWLDGPDQLPRRHRVLRPQANVSVQLSGGPFLPSEQEGDRHVQRRSGAPVTLTYKFETGRVPQGRLRVRHGQRRDRGHLAQSDQPPEPRAGGAEHHADAGECVRPARDPGDQDRRGRDDHDSGRQLVRPGDARRDAGALVALGRRAAVGALGPVRAPARPGRGSAASCSTTSAPPNARGRRSSATRSSEAPAGEANPGPWVERMRFWTAMHEIGHAFNLAHSWQKSLGTAWVPLADEPAALSYMNYPYNYPGGLDAFFAAFEYGFSPDELLFMRHAPERFVKMGDEPWFSNHGFEQEAFDQLRAAVTGPLELEVRVHREPRFEFLEPVVVELRLKNVSSTPMVVDGNVLRGDSLAIVVAKKGGATKRWLPFARHCLAPAPSCCSRKRRSTTSVFVSAGTGGWLISEPGGYTVYAAIEAESGAAHSASRCGSSWTTRHGGAPSGWPVTCSPLTSRTRWPSVALASSTGANEALPEVAEQLPDSQAAVHANAVLGAPMALRREGARTDADGDETAEVVAASPEAGARAALRDARRFRPGRRIARTHRGDPSRPVPRRGTGEGEETTRQEPTCSDGSADALARRGVLPGVVEALRQH